MCFNTKIKTLPVLFRGCGLFIFAALAISCTVDRKPAFLSNDERARRAIQSQEAINGGGADAAVGDHLGDGGGISGQDTSVMIDSGAKTTDTAQRDSGSNGDSALKGDGAVNLPDTKYGLTCGKVTCAPVRVDVDQCCTTGEDVAAKRAQAVDKCGVNLTRRGGPSCLQMEQPGMVDSTCGAVKPAGMLDQEPGCCTAEGRCGTYNALDGIGCHYQKNPGKVCASVDTKVKCERTGVFALRSNISVSWGGRTGGVLIGLTESGRGKIPVQLLAEINEVNATGKFSTNVKICSVELPSFYSELLCEAYQPVFPHTIWDATGNVGQVANGSYSCDNPGCFLTLDPTTLMVGIELDDPDQPWPTAEEAPTFKCAHGAGVDCFPDMDGDGQPGITIDLLTEGKAPPSSGCDQQGYTFAAPPLAASIAAIVDGVRRTDRIDLGFRVRFGGASMLTEECGFKDGTGLAEYAQNRSGGCMVQEGTYNLFSELPVGPNIACNAEETAFMNGNLPQYDVLAAGEKPPQTDLTDNSPSEGASFELTRLGNAGEKFTCRDVRDLFAK